MFSGLALKEQTAKLLQKSERTSTRWRPEIFLGGLRSAPRKKDNLVLFARFQVVANMNDTQMNGR